MSCNRFQLSVLSQKKTAAVPGLEEEADAFLANIAKENAVEVAGTRNIWTSKFPILRGVEIWRHHGFFWTDC